MDIRTERIKLEKEDFFMKKVKWLGLAMLALLLMLTGCNQGDEEEPAEQSTDEQSAEDSQDNEAIIGIAETFVDQLSVGNYEEATEHFDETMASQLTAADLEELWQTLNNQVGNYIEKEYQSTEEAEGHQIVLITGVFNDADVTFQFAFNANEQISGFYVR